MNEDAALKETSTVIQQGDTLHKRTYGRKENRKSKKARRSRSMEQMNIPTLKISRYSSISDIKVQSDDNEKSQTLPTQNRRKSVLTHAVSFNNHLNIREEKLEFRTRSLTQLTAHPPSKNSFSRKAAKNLSLKISTKKLNFLSPHSFPGQTRSPNFQRKSFKNSSLSSGIFKTAEVNTTNLFFGPFVAREECELQRKINVMLRSIQKNDCKSVKTLLKKKFIVLTEFKNKDSLLHEACYNGCIKCVKLLLKYGCTLDSTDDNGFFAIHAAIIGKHFQLLCFLLDNGVNANSVSNDGWSGMHLAIIMANDPSIPSLKMLDVLTKHGGDPFLTTVLDVTPFQLCINLEQTLLLDYYIIWSSIGLSKNT